MNTLIHLEFEIPSERVRGSFTPFADDTEMRVYPARHTGAVSVWKMSVEWS